MFWFKFKKEKEYQRHAESQVVVGAESFKFGRGNHAILFIHGWTSSPRDLRFLAERLKDSYYCMGIRLEGHGMYPELLKYTTWRGHFRQVSEAIEELEKRYDKITLIGFSYGAVLAMHAAVAKKITNLALLAPYIRSTENIIGWLPDTFLVPFIPSFIKYIPKGWCDPINDPLANEKHICYNRMPVKPLKSLFDCIKQVIPLIPQIHCPVLLLHSRGDKTADFQGSRYIYDHLGSEDKSFSSLIMSNHVITLDFDRDRVEKKVLSWLNSHR
jgi:carboxylesterase